MLEMNHFNVSRFDSIENLIRPILHTYIHKEHDKPKNHCSQYECT